MSEMLLSVENLSKRYCRDLRRSLRYGVQDLVGELTGASRENAALRPGEYYALRDISFELARGESLAVIGENGSGKSTLLKILYGLLKPNGGRARIRGSVEAIIELGSGLNELLTGRENVLLGSALHGLSGTCSRDLIDRVVDFAGLEDAIDGPVQTYSSGMKARLAFAMAAQFEPDLLLVDEVLAVGDFAYQRKCINHMHDYLDAGGSLIFVSHNTFQIQAVCQRGLLLEAGQMVFSGSAVDTLNISFERRTAASAVSEARGRTAGPVVIREASFEGVAETGQALVLKVGYTAYEPLEIVWGFTIWTIDRSICVTGDYELAGRQIAVAGDGELKCVIQNLPLLPGRYVVRVAIAEHRSGAALALSDADQPLDVRGQPDRLSNAQAQFRQLTKIDVDWR